MSRALTLAAIALLVFLAPQPTASGQPTTSGRTPRGDPLPVVFELFVRPDSEQCRKARTFLSQLEAKRAGIQVKVHDVLADPAALRRLWDLTRRGGHAQAGLPTIYGCDQLQVGYDRDETTGRAVADWLTIHAYVRQGCSHCRDAKQFLDALVRRRPALTVRYYDVARDAAASQRMQQLVRQYQRGLPLTPTLHFAGHLIVGYQSDATTGRDIEAVYQDRSAPVAAPAPASPRETPSEPQRPTSNSDSPTASRTISYLGVNSRAAAPRLPFSLLSPAWISLPAWSSSTHGLIAGQPPDEPPGQAELAEPAPPDPAPAPPAPEPGPIPEPAPPLDASSPAGESTAPSRTGERQPDAPNPIGGHPAAPAGVELPMWGYLEVRDVGMPAFTFLLGLVDGFNPCAMWVLVLLLSILVNVRDRGKLVMIAGTFVLVSGLAYFTFMAAWLNLFQLVAMERPVQLALGCLALFIGAVHIKDFFAFHQGLTLSIPESAKPGLYARLRKIVLARSLAAAVAGAIALAVVVNVIELLCTAGLPAIYSQILTMQHLPAWANYGYLALYNVAYMLDDSIILAIAVVTLSHRRLQQREGRWLKLISGLVISGLGGVMVFFPAWLR